MPKLIYATSGAPTHDFPGHPECAARVPAILEALQAKAVSAETNPQARPRHTHAAGSNARCTQHPGAAPSAHPLLPPHTRAAPRPQVSRLEGFAPATLEQVLSIHDRGYNAGLEQASGSAAGGAINIEQAPTYATMSTYSDAFKARCRPDAAGASLGAGPPPICLRTRAGFSARH